MSVALVLAGGGVSGIAWETGVLLGCAEAGLDLVGGADLIIGTSAGSTVAAQVTGGRDLAGLWEDQTGEGHPEILPHFDAALVERIFSLLDDGGTSTDAERAGIGALALAAPTVDEGPRRAVITGRIGEPDWPAGPLVITAIDALTGAFTAWTAHSGVGLADAVAASCAVPGVWPCATVGTRRYYDGGMRNAANAHLAAGHDTVWVLLPGGMNRRIADDLADLGRAGARVRVIAADAGAREAMGPNPLNPRYRRASAEHGHRQGRAAAG